MSAVTDTPGVMLSSLPEQNTIKARKRYSLLGLALAGMLLVMYSVVSIVSGVMAFINPDIVDSSLFIMILNFLAVDLFAFLFVFLVTLPINSSIPLRRPMSVKAFLAVSVIIFASMNLFAYVGQFTAGILKFLPWVSANDFLNDSMTDMPVWQDLLFTVILAPIFEELIFRKLLIDKSRAYGEGLSILFSGIVFGLLHGNFYQFFYAAVIGFVLAWVYTRYGNVIICILLHMLANFTCGTIPSIINDFNSIAGATDPTTVMGQILPAIAGLLTFVSFLAPLVCLAGAVIIITVAAKRNIILPSLMPELPVISGSWLKVLILNPGMIVYMAISALEFGASLVT